MGNEKIVEPLDKLIERSERWSKDAEKRKGLNSFIFYEGQTKAFEEVKQWFKEIDFLSKGKSVKVYFYGRDI